jgi:hypothetical protein
MKKGEKTPVTDTIEKKLREAQHRLAEMRDQESRAFGDREPFDYALSGFLNAATAARGAYRVEQDRQRNAAVKHWKANWEGQLTGDDKRIYDYLAKDRVAEMHKSGSNRNVTLDKIALPVGAVYSDKSGTVTSMGSNIPGTGMGGAAIYKPRYTFTIDGVKHDVTGVCAKYLALLEGMAAKFRADNP